MEKENNQSNNNNILSSIQTEFDEADLLHNLQVQIRFFRKLLKDFTKKINHKEFKDILYLTLNETPVEYIQAFKKQYPDKEIKVIVPIFSKNNRYEKTDINFEFFLQNRIQHSILYKIPKTRENIEVYGLYTSAFEKMDSEKDITKLEYLAPYIKSLRICTKKLNPSLIHADNIPFYLGYEFESAKRFPIKVLQIVHDFAFFEVNKHENFWAAINLVNEDGMKKICRDKIIKKCIADLFNLHNAKRFYPMRECLEFIYDNYFKFRKYVDKCEDIEENVIFNRLNNKILTLFPQMKCENDSAYNSIFYSIKKSDFWATISKTYYEEIFNNPVITGKSYELIQKYQIKSDYVSFRNSKKEESLYQKFTTENFRERRCGNKKYLIREFSKERVATKFSDISLFKTNNYTVKGHLDSCYNAPLILGIFSPEIFLQGIDIAFDTILKLFHNYKNVQFIINIPNGLKNNYINSWVKFLEERTELKGKWIYIDNEINPAKFFAASDMILLPKRGNIATKEHYQAMNYGCIPIASRSGIYNDTISDIFDDITYGCGFKTKIGLFTNENTNEIFQHIFNKALNLYTNNPSSWNLLIKNAMNYNSEWDFDTIEHYNKIYENI